MQHHPPQARRTLQAERARRGWTQEEFVEYFEATARDLGLGLSLSVRQLRRWEAPQPPWPHPPYRRVLHHIFGEPVEALGFRRPRKGPVPDDSGASAPSLEPVESVAEEDDEVLRRAFLRSGAGALLADSVALALLAPADSCPSDEADVASVRRDAARAKGAFQSCRYDELARMLPRMLAAAGTAVEAATSSDARAQALVAQTDLLHATTSLLLKQGRTDLALVAADRAAQAAHASQDPTAQLSAARIVAHAGFAAGHDAIATELVNRNADRFAAFLPGASPELTSAYGSLLLRGSIASARLGDRGRTAELLNEAQRLAAGLHPHANHAWTSFNTNNVLVHRVATAVELGDAGYAIDTARSVQMAAIAVVERRAALWVDIARAFGQWHKDEPAVRALLTAEHIAPQEVRGRQAVRLLIEQLQRQQRGPANKALTELAHRVGASA